MEYYKHLSEPWFSLIKLELKTVEGRLLQKDFAKMKIGDTVIWFNDDFGFRREIKTKITDIKYFKDFDTYLKKEKLKKCLPVLETYEEGVMLYHKYFTPEEEKNFGVVSFHLKL